MTDFDCSKHRSNMSIKELDKCKKEDKDYKKENYNRIVGKGRK